MKKLIFLICIGVLVISACEKEDIKPSKEDVIADTVNTIDTVFENPIADTVNVIDTVYENPITDTIDIDSNIVVDTVVIEHFTPKCLYYNLPNNEAIKYDMTSLTLRVDAQTRQNSGLGTSVVKYYNPIVVTSEKTFELSINNSKTIVYHNFGDSLIYLLDYEGTYPQWISSYFYTTENVWGVKGTSFSDNNIESGSCDGYPELVKTVLGSGLKKITGNENFLENQMYSCYAIVHSLLSENNDTVNKACYISNFVFIPVMSVSGDVDDSRKVSRTTWASGVNSNYYGWLIYYEGYYPWIKTDVTPELIAYMFYDGTL